MGEPLTLGARVERVTPGSPRWNAGFVVKLGAEIASVKWDGGGVTRIPHENIRVVRLAGDELERWLNA